MRQGNYYLKPEKTKEHFDEVIRYYKKKVMLKTNNLKKAGFDYTSTLGYGDMMELIGKLEDEYGKL